jgi:hypothetical protein
VSAPASAPDADEEEPLSVTCGVIAYALAITWLALCGASVAAAVDEIRTPAVDVHARCEFVHRTPCLSATPARSMGAGDFLTDAGRVSVADANSVPTGRRVDLEYWAGNLVSVYDSASGSRSRTDAWEQGWRSHGGGPIGTLVVASLFAALPLWGVVYATFAVLRLGVRRLRRAEP